jgi:hypothetical protein
MIHPHTELRFINSVIGFGVVATARIPRGTITWVRDPLDRAMSADDVDALGGLFRAQLDRFMFVDGACQRILCWDIAKYVNHSCDPVCLAPGFDFELAVRDIEPGEELCDDYGTLNPQEPFDCACEAPSCRGVVRPDDHLRLADAWDERVRKAFPSIASVEQPLWPLVNRRDEIAASLEGRAPVPSCRAHLLGAPEPSRLRLAASR